MRSYGVFLSLSFFFHLTKCPQGPSILLKMTGFSFLWLNGTPVYLPTYLSVCLSVCLSVYPYIFFIHSSLDEQVGCFCVLAIVNKAEVKMWVRYLFEWWFMCGIAGSYGGSIFKKILRKLHTYFYIGCANLHSYRECIKISFCSQPPQHLLSPVFLMLAILTGIGWSLTWFPFTLL